METHSERGAEAAPGRAPQFAADDKTLPPPAVDDKEALKLAVAAARAIRNTRWAHYILRVAEPLSVAAVIIYILDKSWLRWLDPLIDFHRSPYVAWRLTEGDLLYRQVMSWYGPLAHLVEATAFRLFGVGLDTLVWLNLALMVLTLLLLRAIFGALGNRLTVWVSSMVFVLVFAFNQCQGEGNANYMTPYASQATYGFIGLLLVLWGLLRQIKTTRNIWLGVAGFGVAMTYLDKPEPLLAAAGTVAVYLLAQAIYLVRGPAESKPMRRWLATGGWLAGGFFSLWLPVFFYFLMRGGLGYAIFATNYVPHELTDPAIHEAVSHSVYQLRVMGFDHPGENFRTQLMAGGLLGLVCLLLWAMTWGWTRARAYGWAWWIGLGAVSALAVTVAVGPGQAGELFDFWLEFGRALAFPLLLAGGGVALWSFWSAWRNRDGFSHDLSLAVVGVAAALMLSRMILNATLYHGGFYMAPLAVFFLFQLMMVEAARFGPGRRRANWLLPTALAGLALFGSVVLCRESLGMYASKTAAISTGRDRFYAYPLRISQAGALLQVIINSVNKLPTRPKTLVVAPEGIAANYHLRIPSSTAVMELIPLGLAYAGPAKVLQELQSNPPDAIFLHYRPYYEFTFSLKYFGDTEVGGSNIYAWINDNYEDIASLGNAADSTITGHTLDLYVPKDGLKAGKN